MARLPSSFRRRNRTTRNFRNQYARLPRNIRELVRAYCIKFNEDPDQASLRRHELEDRRQGSHEPKSISVSITMRYRAIYFVDHQGINVWYWIGTHDDYDTFTGGR